MPRVVNNTRPAEKSKSAARATPPVIRQRGLRGQLFGMRPVAPDAQGDRAAFGGPQHAKA